jgi:shikimate dehydrogenase
MRLFGLTGFPLGHSKSKEYFDQKFGNEGISGCRYELFPISDISKVRQLAAGYPELEGLNVTIPHKQTVIPFLDETDEVSRRINAVNCIRISRQNGRLFLSGYNTDAPAFRKSIMQLLKSSHIKALILGTGGASKAIQDTLNQLNINYTLVSRNPEKGEIAYKNLDETVMGSHRLIINASPVGMFPDTGQIPAIPYTHLTDAHLLYDLVYNPETTGFLKKGAEMGATIKNGLEMLHLQADMSWEIWNKEDQNTD